MFSLYRTVNFLAKKGIERLHKEQFLNITEANLWLCICRKLSQSGCKVHENIANKRTETVPFMMKLDTPEFKSLFTEALCQLAALFKENQYELRIAGGAVRDLVLGIKPKDIDFATTATPEQMKLMFTANLIKMINNKGEKHGTITARIDQENFEVTTLRIDIRTDGRHADVEFTKDWRLDANRRDLTVNSMFLDLDGNLYDYFNGYEDLLNKRIVFVGDPGQRIKEDYLRILRYFRFYGRIADRPDNHDEKCLEVIQENVSGLKQISGERIWLELQKLVVGNFAGDLLKVMHKVGIFPYIGLPENPNFDDLDTVLNLTKNKRVNPITIIVPMLRNQQEMLAFHARCKLSGYERDLGTFLILNRNEKGGSLISYKKLIVYTKAKVSDSKEWVLELLKYKNELNFINDIQSWNVPKFPVSGIQLSELGVPGGKKMGAVIDSLKLIWADSEFKLTDKELVEQHLPDVLQELGIEKKKI